MKVKKRRVQNIEKKGRISMVNIKDFEEEDKIKDLWSNVSVNFSGVVRSNTNFDRNHLFC
jgi:hypothetical protein